MTLRTPNPSSSKQSLLDLQRVKERYAVLQEQLTTGKRITRIGDDPTGAALIVDFKSSVDRNKEYMKSIQSARSLLTTSETVLTSMNNSIVRLLELGQQGLSSTIGASGRAQISPEVDGIRTALLSTANTQSDGKYIFSGASTTTQPFSGPATGPITYAGGLNSIPSNTIQVDVSMGTPVATNLTGDVVFFGSGGQGSSTDVFQAVTDLRDGLNSNNTALIQTAFNNLKNYQSHLNDMVTQLGGRQAMLNQMESNLGEYNTSLQAIQSSYEDVDYASAATEFTKLEYVQQAALSSLGRMNRQNLFDYLS
jgi:flagellar hook-associated protein 3 FlgL